MRHPELFATNTTTKLDDIWKHYKDTHLHNLKNPDRAINIYNNHIYPEFGKYHVNFITPYKLEIFKQKLLSKLKSGTAHQILKFLRSLINKGKEWSLIPDEYNLPRNSIAIPNADSKRERFLKPQEAKQILDSLQLYNCDLYYISKIALYTGMRLGEIVSLNVDNIDLDSNIIYVDGKTGKRVAYISENIIDDLQYLMKRNNSKFLFMTNTGNVQSKTSISCLFSRFIKFSGLNDGVISTQKIVFHTFRHTFCSWLAMDGVPLFTIGQLVGHSTTRMTERYAKLSPDYKRQALQFIHKQLVD